MPPTKGAPLPRNVTLHLPRPHDAQQQVIDTAHRFNVLCCGRRWGKTVLGVDRLIQPAIATYPVAWFSPTYKMLLEAWRDIKRTLAPVTVRASDAEHRIELLGGGVVEAWSLETPDSARGRRYKRVVIDEAAMVRDLRQTWQAVIRPTLTDFEGDAWFLSTPRGLNEFHELYQFGTSGERPEWAAWRMPSSSNPFLPPGELESARSDLGPLTYAQEYDADFTALGDAAFPEFREDTHIIPTDYEMIARWRRVAGHDWGYSSPAATLWFAIDPAGGAVAYREWSVRHLQPDEVAQGILYRQGDENPIIYGDPAMWREGGRAYLTTEMIATLAEHGKLELTTATQYQQAGVSMQPANNARIPGKLRLHTLLGKRPADGVPYLRFMDCCPDAIATFQNIQLDPDRSGEDVMTDFPSGDPVWRRDEYYDVTRYALMGVPTKVTQEPGLVRERPRWRM